MIVYICDDEKKILQDISEVVSGCCKDSNIYTFVSAIELLKQMEKQSADILLLDIDMPDMNGMEVAKYIGELKEKPILIFVSSHDELVYESFKYHPFGFVRKRFFKEELPKLLNDCKEELQRNTKNFCFRADGKDVRLVISEIIYLESEANYVKVFTKDKEYRFRSTMTAVENTLHTYGFIRIHKGFLVNEEAVRVVGSDEAELVDGRRLPVGKTYLDSARSQLMRYMR